MRKRKVVHIQNGILFHHKNNEILSFVTAWMELEIIMLSEKKKKKSRHRKVSYDLTHTWNLKSWSESRIVITKGWGR
jgi:hypothetical protein